MFGKWCGTARETTWANIYSRGTIHVLKEVVVWFSFPVFDFFVSYSENILCNTFPPHLLLIDNSLYYAS